MEGAASVREREELGGGPSARTGEVTAVSRYEGQERGGGRGVGSRQGGEEWGGERRGEERGGGKRRREEEGGDGRKRGIRTPTPPTINKKNNATVAIAGEARGLEGEGRDGRRRHAPVLPRRRR